MHKPHTDLPPFVFGTKAETLAALEGRVASGLLCRQHYFSRAEWQSGQAGIEAIVKEQFGSCAVAIRSSALTEDGESDSLAGAFLSIINVDASDSVAVRTSVDQVISSFKENDPRDQVLIQPMVQGVALSGVAMSRDIDTGAPYFVVNYDDFSGRTDTVTAGAESKTIMVLRSGTRAVHSPRIAKVLECLTELESVTGCALLDMEFCITDSGDLYVLQVRRMAMTNKWTVQDVRRVESEISDIRNTIATLLLPVDHLAGASTLFGEMPDWNPVEMLGSTPKPLAMSLYRALITDSAWSQARSNMGYRDVGPSPLMHDFSGKPFIDVRLSLNSFLPVGLDPDCEERLINAQIEKLRENRDLHDKIEFHVAVTCLDFGFDSRVPDLEAAGLSPEEIEIFRDKLLALTDTFLSQGSEAINNRLDAVRQLDGRRLGHDEQNPVDYLRTAIPDCMENGTIPFAELARHGFVGVSLLRSMVDTGLIDAGDRDRFFASVHTVTSEFVSDISDLASGALSLELFLKKYGHLRPGTYDITSLRYDELPSEFLLSDVTEPQRPDEFSLDDDKKNAIDSRLRETGFGIGVDALFDYIRAAICAREESKFLFTRTLSEILQKIVAWGDAFDLTRDDLAFLRIEDILSEQDESSLRRKIETSRDEFSVTQSIRLPHLIVEPDDVEVVRIPLGHPTYITSETVSGRCKTIDDLGAQIEGHIVLINSADPGYDWIFSHKLAGLITEFGGANSHMAIRCAEFGIPAAIGCGSRLFQQAVSSGYVELNCASGTIRFLRQS